MSRLYGIVDTARDPLLYPLVIQSPNYDCLFAGEIKEPLNRAAPYLVELTDDTPLKDIWRDRGWGQAWGILLRSPLDLKEMRRHLRKFLLAQLPDGSTVMFRFYDPRVWRTYWPTCTPEEQGNWMKGVDEFVVEPEGQIAMKASPEC
jgi:hypothetical protein